MSEVITRGKTYFLSSESSPHGQVENVDNIEDATLFVSWKFALHLEKELEKPKSVIFSTILQKCFHIPTY